MSTDGIFMFLTSALGPEGKSFEEVRVEDYVRSYQSTGRPPPPVPQEPTDELQRKALGLPPLFKPQTNITLASGSASSSTPSSMLSSTFGFTSTTLLPSLLPNTTTTTKPRIVNPADIPVGQEFRTHIVAAEKYQTIVCMPEYEGFSSEELRCHAYFGGNMKSPVPITMDPFVPQAKELSTSTASAALSDEKLQSQCALPECIRHSPEELRVAFMVFGREMTSNDLLGPQVPASSAVTSAAPPNATPITPLAPAVVPPPVIATAPSASKFNFVFR